VFDTCPSWLQTISIRVAGFNSIDVNKLNLALLWLYTGTPSARARTHTYTHDAVHHDA
jgi:hypothetical protein